MINSALADCLLITSEFFACLLCLLHMQCNETGRADIIFMYIWIFSFVFASLLTYDWRHGPILAFDLCFEYRWRVHALVVGPTCKAIPLSYSAHLRPICSLVSSLQACEPHLKSFGYVNPAPHPVSP